VLVGALVLAYSLAARPALLHAEGGPIEDIQFGGWLVGALVCAVLALRGRRRGDRLMPAWLGVLAVGCAARELDLHEKLNSDVIGSLGVHYRIDWWLDGAVPLWLKAGWALVALVVLALVVLPPLLVRPPTARLLRAGDAGTWLLLLAGLLLFGGYAFDDLFGRGRFIEDVQVTKAIEESLELGGVAAFLGSVLAGFGAPLSVRARRVGRGSPET
jgi:hypothetical protein